MAETVRFQLQSALAGRYELERELGRGGMATVYLARDIRHERLVALKVLDPELGAVLGADRFLSEIRVTANLQHPHLLPLFDSGAADGLLYYVMPFVEGESLRAKLARETQLPVDEAVRIAVAVAEALAYAHGHGVIHRDLKPENILLQHGQPVLADFGIALAISNAGGQRVTQTGLSLGTPQYMSPEQATGDRAIDARTDIYSLGAVTYEMLAGEPPHSGSSAQAIIARLMTEEPRPLSTVRRTVPAHVEMAVERALHKLPADRFATAKEFADTLLGRIAPQATGATHARSAAATRRRVMPWAVVAGVVGVVIGALAVRSWGTSHDVPIRPIRFVIDPPAGMFLSDRSAERPFAIAPDGQSVAFTAGPNAALFLRRFDQLEPTSVARVQQPFGLHFSPDGNWIAFRDASAAGVASLGLFKVPVGGAGAGSTPSLIADSAAGVGMAWTVGSEIVFARRGSLWHVPATGGPSREIPRDSAVDGTWSNPTIMSDGKTIAFRLGAKGARLGTSDDRLGLVSIDGGPRTKLDVEAQNVLGYMDGYVIYGRSDGRVFAQRMNLASRTLEGDPVMMLENVSTKVPSGAAAAISANGTLAYVSGNSTTRVDLVDERGATIATLPAEKNRYVSVNWSPDGRKLLLAGSGPQAARSSDLWVYDTASHVTTRLTQESETTWGVWTPDSKQIAILRLRGTGGTQLAPGAAVQIMPADGSRAPEPVPAAQKVGLSTTFHISSDGKYLLMTSNALRPARDNLPALNTPATAVPLDGGPIIPLLANVKTPSAPVTSPDSRWIAYASNESGRREVYVRPFPNGNARVQVSSNGGQNVGWIRDGRVVYQANGSVWAATLDLRGDTPRLVRSDSLFVLPEGSDFSFHPDGKRIAVLREVGEGKKLVVVTNWWNDMKTKLEKH